MKMVGWRCATDIIDRGIQPSLSLPSRNIIENSHQRISALNASKKFTRKFNVAIFSIVLNAEE